MDRRGGVRHNSRSAWQYAPDAATRSVGWHRGCCTYGGDCCGDHTADGVTYLPWPSIDR